MRFNKPKATFVFLHYANGSVSEFKKVKRRKRKYEIIAKKEGEITISFLVKNNGVYEVLKSHIIYVHFNDIVKVSKPFKIRGV